MVVLAASVGVTWVAGRFRTGEWFEEAVLVQVATRTIGLGAAAGLLVCLAWQSYRAVQRSTT